MCRQSLAAWPTKSAKTEESSQQEPIATAKEILIQQESEVEQPSPTGSPKMLSTDYSTINSKELMQRVVDLQNSLESSKKVTVEIKDTVAELASAFQAYTELEQVEDALAKENSAKLDRMAASNVDYANRNVELETEKEILENALKKEQSTKMFTNIGLVVGFQDKTPVYGASAQVGVRLGKGLTLAVGGQYMFGTFTNAKFESDIDRMAFTGSVGWEW